MLVFGKTSIEGEESFLMTKFEVLNFYYISFFYFFLFIRISGECFFESMFNIFYLIYNCSAFGCCKKKSLINIS